MNERQTLNQLPRTTVCFLIVTSLGQTITASLGPKKVKGPVAPMEILLDSLTINVSEGCPH
jgi:hypothetical protein